MLDLLRNKLSSLFNKASDNKVLTKEKIKIFIDKIRDILIDTDTSFAVVESFIDNLQNKIEKQDINANIQKQDFILKCLHDELIELFTQNNSQLKKGNPSIVMLVGLQGHGKTTSAAKLAKILSRDNKVLLVSLDMYRKGGRFQLGVLAQENKLEYFSHDCEELSTAISLVREQIDTGGYDYILLDTAGVVDINDTLQELVYIKEHFDVNEILLTLDINTGQIAEKIITSFGSNFIIDGFIATKLDSDAKGGALLSVSYISQKPIKFICNGEKIDDIDQFDPKGFVSRLLGQGDIMGLVRKATTTMDKQSLEQSVNKIQSGVFNLDDYYQQLKQVAKMGAMQNLLKFLPAAATSALKKNNLDDDNIKKQIVIMHSMTKKERRFPEILNLSRKKRIMKGSATFMKEVDNLIKQYNKIKITMKKAMKMNQGALPTGNSSIDSNMDIKQMIEELTNKNKK